MKELMTLVEFRLPEPIKLSSPFKADDIKTTGSLNNDAIKIEETISFPEPPGARTIERINLLVTVKGENIDWNITEIKNTPLPSIKGGIEPVLKAFQTLQPWLHLVATLAPAFTVEWAFMEAINRVVDEHKVDESPVINISFWSSDDATIRHPYSLSMWLPRYFSIVKTMQPSPQALTEDDFNFIGYAYEHWSLYWYLWFKALRTVMATPFKYGHFDLGLSVILFETAVERAVIDTQEWKEDAMYSPRGLFAKNFEYRKNLPIYELASLCLTRHRVVHRGKLEYIDVKMAQGNDWKQTYDVARESSGIVLTREHCLNFAEKTREAIQWLEQNRKIISAKQKKEPS